MNWFRKAIDCAAAVGCAAAAFVTRTVGGKAIVDRKLFSFADGTGAEIQDMVAARTTGDEIWAAGMIDYFGAAAVDAAVDVYVVVQAKEKLDRPN